MVNELEMPWRVDSVEVVNCSTAGLVGCRCNSVVLAFRQKTKHGIGVQRRKPSLTCDLRRHCPPAFLGKRFLKGKIVLLESYC